MEYSDMNLIAKYMGWNIKHSEAHVLGLNTKYDFYTYHNGFNSVLFDNNTVFYCANEIFKRGQWHSFVENFYDCKKSIDDMFFLMLDRNHFFTRMAEWLRTVIYR
jgi:hypothetical protein